MQLYFIRKGLKNLQDQEALNIDILRHYGLKQTELKRVWKD